MLRRIGFRRVVALQPAAASASIAAVEATASLAEDANETTPGPESLTPSGGRWFTLKRAILATLVVSLASGACAYSQKERFSAQAADLSRRVIGDERTAQVEGWVFRLEDRLDQIKYRITGSEKNPFATREIQIQFVPQAAAREIVYFAGSGGRNSGLALTAEALGPLPLKLPATHVFFS